MQILEVQLYSTMNYLTASDSGIMVNFGNVISSVSNYTFLSLSVKIALPPMYLYNYILLNWIFPLCFLLSIFFLF